MGSSASRFYQDRRADELKFVGRTTEVTFTVVLSGMNVGMELLGNTVSVRSPLLQSQPRQLVGW